MEDDKTAENFSDSLFTYLWFTQNFISETTAAKAVGDSSDFIAKVSEAVLMLSSFSAPGINQRIESYFAKNLMTRRNVFTFLATWCFEHHSEINDIFSVILNTCVFVFKILLYCHDKGDDKFLDFASMCWTEIFMYDLRKEFYDKGGWDEFERYISERCYVSQKYKKDNKYKCTDFLNDVPYLFQRLKVSKEDDFTIPSTEDFVEDTNTAVHDAKVIDKECMDCSDCQNSLHFVSTSICEANITPEEAISAYELLTNFYGQNCAKLNCEQNCEDTMYSDFIDMEHVYKTLSNFINQGILEVEASTGRIIQPNIIHNANIHNGTLCCSNCQHEEQVTIISSDTTRTKIYPSSLVTELVRDDSNVCSVKSDDHLNTR